MKIFIFLEVLLFTYIFNTSIYSIYEKNHVANEELAGYVIVGASPEILDDFYTLFMEYNSGNKLEIVNNAISSTNQSEYDIYCYPINKFKQKQPISQSILFRYHELEREDYLDSVGIFYSDLTDDEISEMSSRLSVSINNYEDESIPYSMILQLSFMNYVILFIVIQTIYCIYTSYSMKKIGIKKSMGFSTLHILKEQIIRVAKIFVLGYLFIFILLNLYYVFTNRYDFSYIAFSLIYFGIVLIINIISVLNTSIMFRLISLESMIKNKTLNNSVNMIVQVVKVGLSVIIAVTIIMLLKHVDSYKRSQQDVLDFEYLEGYYTANGFNSLEYDYAINNPDILQEYSDNTLKLYNNKSLLCDSSNYSDIQSSGNDFESAIIVANSNYLNEFSNILFNKEALGKEIIKEPTVFIPYKYKNDINQIKAYIDEEYYRLMNYNQFYGLQKEKDYLDDYDIVYMDDDSSLKVNMENGFSDVTDPIIIVDTGDFAGLYYLDCLNMRCLLFQMKSRNEFSSLLSKCSMDKLVIAGTLLTPYMMEFENTTFVLKTIVLFTLVFIISLIFIIYIANYVHIIVNRKKYAIKEIMGYSHFYILKNRYVFFGIRLIIITALIPINKFFVCFMIILSIDCIFCELLYKMYIINALYEIEKGA